MSLLLIVSILVLLVVQEWHLLSLLQLSLCLIVSLYSETKPFYLKKMFVEQKEYINVQVKILLLFIAKKRIYFINIQT